MAQQWLLIVQPTAKRAFNNLQRGEKRAVFRRLEELLNADDPYALPFVEMLQATRFERNRKFRVGDYRIFFVIESIAVTHLKHTYKGTVFLLDIRNRNQAYD
jgi:mRNA-degrading endonuclease RelE of RelBE toxin-antitoxin system